uniref:PWWP domain containing 2A n=1 Tax=Monopterus albus TaxID=43700 RepID=A0A3Q3Q7E6_MONAL
MDLVVPRVEDSGDGEERRHVRPELEPAGGRALCENTVNDELIGNFPVDRNSTDRFSPGLPGDPEGGGNVSVQEVYRSILPDPQPSAVFLHSFPAPPPVTEAGLSLAEPQEKVAAEDFSRPEHGPEPCLSTVPLASVQDLSPGSEVRVSLDHVIDDALVVSFRLGEKVFSGVLMDVSKRFGPYGIPITVFPRRDDRTRPQVSLQSQPVSSDDSSSKQEEVNPTPLSHPWTSKPPPLFQEGAPYPPPLFIRDTYNQALPQPPPRKIKRPKRRYRCEEPTSIMNAIKLRPRQVLCDKCKGVVVSGGHREARRGPVDLRGEEATRRRRPAEGPISSEVKRLRSDDKGGRTAADRRPSSAIRVSSSSSSSSRRVLRGVASSSSSSSSSRMHLKLNSKKVLAQSSASDRSKARQVLKKLAVTRAAALQNHNQKVHFTRRLQHLSGAGISPISPTPLPPRMRLKPQRYRTDDSQTVQETAAFPLAVTPSLVCQRGVLETGKNKFS